MRTLLCVVALFGLPTHPVAAKVKVVTTLPDFAAIAAELGGDRVEAESLIRGTQDPHYVDAKPSYVLKVSQADLKISFKHGIREDTVYMESGFGTLSKDLTQTFGVGASIVELLEDKVDELTGNMAMHETFVSLKKKGVV